MRITCTWKFARSEFRRQIDVRCFTTPRNRSIGHVVVRRSKHNELVQKRSAPIVVGGPSAVHTALWKHYTSRLREKLRSSYAVPFQNSIWAIWSRLISPVQTKRCPCFLQQSSRSTGHAWSVLGNRRRSLGSQIFRIKNSKHACGILWHRGIPERLSLERYWKLRKCWGSLAPSCFGISQNYCGLWGYRSQKLEK